MLPVMDGSGEETTVTCPYCAQRVSIALDPSGGANQEYDEDCQVCCRPWLVRVRYDDHGGLEVSVDPAQ